MAKSPRKHSNQIGGKNFANFSKRRFSIADSDDEEGEDDDDEANNDSDSSLTAVSEGEGTMEIVRSRLNSSGRKKLPKKTMDWYRKTNENAINDDSSSNSDEDDDEDELGIEELYSMVGKAGSGRGGAAADNRDNSDSDSNSNSDSDSDSDDYSSSDDSDVDFVKLQAERKARSMKAVKALKGLRKDRANGSRRKSSVHHKIGRRKSEVALPGDINFKFEFDDLQGDAIDDEEDDIDGKALISDEVTLNGDFTAAGSGGDVDHHVDIGNEDIGEEIQNIEGLPTNEDAFNFDLPVPKFKEEELNSDEDYEIDDNELLATLQADNDDFGVGMNIGNATANADTSSASHRNNSIASVDEEEDPFLKEEEKFLVNEFENNGFDDEDRNMLMDTFNLIHNQPREDVMQYESSDSDGDVNGDDDDNYDGYDDEDDEDELIDFSVDQGSDSGGNGDEFGDAVEEPLVRKKKSKTSKSKKSSKSKSKSNGIRISNSDEEDDLYLWNYFFSSDNDSGQENNSMNAEGDDEDFDDSEEQVIVEELFKQMEKDDKKRRIREAAALAAATAATSTGRFGGAVLSPENNHDSDLEYDTGESTDVDLSVPTYLNKIKSGSIKAKEVLSSRTADYRPPILGTWVAVDSKPFGIIDGLSTRSLQQGRPEERASIPRAVVSSSDSSSSSLAGGTSNGASGENASKRNQNSSSQQEGGTSNLSGGFSNSNATGNIDGGGSSANGFPLGLDDNSDNLALGLDELLNVSELDDDDENDVKIWQDFNSQKKLVPLGAFRNKSLLHNQNVLLHHHIPHSTSSYKTNNEISKSSRRNSSTNSNNANDMIRKPSVSRRRSSASSTSNSHVPSKQKRRRASIIEAVSEGFRPTRSGLFSENALANVEEVLGDDHDLMALIKGL